MGPRVKSNYLTKEKSSPFLLSTFEFFLDKVYQGGTGFLHIR
jgi:hypothetical protein